MQFNDKKALALTLQYIDDLLEERLESRIEELEKLVESSKLVVKEGNEFTLVEGPEGQRGPRGFRGPEGEIGNKGEDANPTDVARQLRIDEGFISSVTGPKGEPGQDGRDANESQIVESLKKSKQFLESIKGERGEQGEMGFEGPTGKAGKDGVGLTTIQMSEEGQVEYIKSDGSVGIAGKIDLPEAYDDSYVLKEIENLKEEMKKVRSDLVAQITRATMAMGGGSSGGGEVEIKFMDDFDHNSLLVDGNVVWNRAIGKFQVQGAPTTTGIQTLDVLANAYLSGGGNIATFPKADTSLENSFLYSVYVVDPSDDQVVALSNFNGTDKIQIESNSSLFNFRILMNYYQVRGTTDPEYIKVQANNYISADGLTVEIPFSDFSFSEIESFVMRDGGYAVDPVTHVLSDRIVFTSSTPMFGMQIELFGNNNSLVGFSELNIPLSTNVQSVDFVSNGIDKVYNHMVVDDANNEVKDVVVYLTPTEIRFESSFNMSGLTLKLWYDPV